jgi:hypothetical protein
VIVQKFQITNGYCLAASKFVRINANLGRKIYNMTAFEKVKLFAIFLVIRVCI